MTFHVFSMGFKSGLYGGHGNCLGMDLFKPFVQLCYRITSPGSDILRSHELIVYAVKLSVSLGCYWYIVRR